MKMTMKTAGLLVMLGMSFTASAELQVHWKLDETSSFTASESVQGYNGALINFANATSSWQSGAVNGALRFDGTNDHVAHGYTFPVTRGTISHWLFLDNTNGSRVAVYQSDSTASPAYSGFGHNTPVQEIHTGMNGGRWSFMYQCGSSDPGNVENLAGYGRFQVSGGVVVSQTWAHVAATWDQAGFMVLYVNGAEVSRTNMSIGVFDSPAISVRQIGRVGDGTASRHWQGKMDDVQIYDAPLAAAEIKMLYDNPGSVISGRTLIASFDFGDTVPPVVPSPVAGPAGIPIFWKTIHTGNAENQSATNPVRFLIRNYTAQFDSRGGYNDLLSDYFTRLTAAPTGANFRIEGLVPGATYELYVLSADGTGFQSTNVFDTIFTIFDAWPQDYGLQRTGVTVLATAETHAVDTGSGFNGVWVEGVNYAKMTFVANGEVVYGTFDAATNGAKGGIAGAQLVMTAPTTRKFWSFPTNGQFDGWGFVNSQTGLYTAKFLVRDVGATFATDFNTDPVLTTAFSSLLGNSATASQPNTPLVIRSPYFSVDASTTITFRCNGGNASSVDPGIGTNAYPSNALGVVFVRASDGVRLFSQRVFESNYVRIGSFDVSAYAGDGKQYYLEIVDNQTGAHVQVDDILYPGTVVSMGPDLQKYVLMTDASWRSIDGGVAVSSNYYLDVNYDDSNAAGWTNAYVDNTGNHIWHKNTSSALGPATARFRKVFNIPRKVYAAYAHLVADDDGHFRVNGTTVWQDTSGSASDIYLNLDPSLFKVGDNLFAIFGQDVISSYHFVAVDLVLLLEPEPTMKFGPEMIGDLLTINTEQMMLNRPHTLQRSTNLLNSAAWTDVSSFTPLHYATNLIYDAGGATNRNGYFRLRSLAP